MNFQTSWWFFLSLIWLWLWSWSCLIYLNAQSSSSSASPKTFDCPMRAMALNYSYYINDLLSSDQLQEIADALNGSPEKTPNNCTIEPNIVFGENIFKNIKPNRWPHSWNSYHSKRPHLQIYIDRIQNRLRQASEEHTIYVDPNNGDDHNNGSFIKPMQTIHAALDKLRNSCSKYDSKKIILRGGRYYIRKTIQLTPKDSNLVICNYEEEMPEISGAIPLVDNDWKLYQTESDGKNIYQLQIKDANTIASGITGIRIRSTGDRAIRARYPNANPETDGFASDLTAVAWVPPVMLVPLPKYEYNPNYPSRNDTTGYNGPYPWFWKYALGMGGICNNFSPNAGYWCSSMVQGGGASTYNIPSGLIYNRTILPHTPYANATGGIIQAWRPGHWASWMFEIGKFERDTFFFSKGGFQDARGATTGQEFYVENIKEELDAPLEFFYNSTARVLYFRTNDTNYPNSQNMEVTYLKILFNFRGTSMTDLLENITLSGVVFRDTAYTYMDPHGMPSGGDWALQRQAAVMFEYASDCIISTNLFTRLDGNAIIFNRYNRRHLVFDNEIVWNGDTAIASWGDTNGITFPSRQGEETSMGWDGTNGNQPRQLEIVANYVHELGIWEKQSSFYFQAKSCLNVISYNIFYNGPRAGINFNDGFGGGSQVLRNLLFNTCRESGDHGPFNSWDRQVYVTEVKYGTPSTIKQWDIISLNFMIANYHSIGAIDNDDGSCFYQTYNNFFVYGLNSGLKSDFGGHSNYHYQNIYAYMDKECAQVSIGTAQMPGYNDAFFSNICVLNANQTEYISFECTLPQDQWPILYSNQVMTQNGTSGLCGLSETAFQQTYNYDLNTTISTWPEDSWLLGMARQMLF